MRLIKHSATWPTIAMLLIFSVVMLANLGNIAYWEDEGETVQLGKSVLKFGYPKVFDGKSFILIDENYRSDNFARLTSPYLQFYLAAFGVKLAGTSANTFLVRLPFASTAILGVWISWFIFKKLKYSRFSLFLYPMLLSTSVQLYLYWRQARHYALQFPLSLGFLWSYLNLDKKWGRIMFLIFGFLFYHAYYPGFAGFYLGILIHALIRKYFDRRYQLKPLIRNTLILITIHFPAALYLRHYGQLPNNGYFNTLAAYLMDINYFGYFKIAVVSVFALIILKKFNLATAGLNLKRLFSAYDYSLSLFSLVIISHILFASLGAHNQRYISVLIPYLFLIVAVLWNLLTKAIAARFRVNLKICRIASLPLLVWLMAYSHPRFFSEIQAFTKELKSEYYGPIEGIVNTISGVQGLKRIDPNLSKQPETLIATNFEDGVIYSYLGNRFLNSLAPADQYKYGSRLPDWVIIRKNWGQEKYLNSFLQKGNYQKIETNYCDLPYENVYLVRTHNFQTVTDCPEGYLTLYRLAP